MEIKIINYSASGRIDVTAFIDLEINGWLRFNGIHLQRDGTLKSAQLTPIRKGRLVFLPAVEVIDADLRELLTADILAAIHAHAETLPPEKRMRPPRPIAPREQRKTPNGSVGEPINVQRAPEKPAAVPHAPPTSAITAPRKPTPEKARSVPPHHGSIANAKTLPPPLRLLANLPRAAKTTGGKVNHFPR